MESYDESLNIESCNEIHKLYIPKPDKCSANTKTASAMSEEYLLLLSDIMEDPISETLCKQNAKTLLSAPDNVQTEVEDHSNSCRAYIYDQQFETYPVLFEWIMRKSADSKNSTDKVTEQDTIISDDCRSNDKQHSVDSKPLSSNNLSPDPKPPFEIVTCNACPIQPSPPFPPCPPEPPLPPCEPNDVKLKCTTGNIDFKLKCTKLPENCDHPEDTYECIIIDEGKYIDSKDLQASDLECEQIHAIYNGHPIKIKEEVNVKGKLIPKEIENNEEDSKDSNPGKILRTVICSKHNANCNWKCTRTTPDPSFPNDIRFICEFEEDASERKVISNDILSIPLRCTQICNIIDDSVLESIDNNHTTKNLNNTQVFTNIHNSQISIDERDECAFNTNKETDKKLKCFKCIPLLEEGGPGAWLTAPPQCYNVNDINEKSIVCEYLSKPKMDDVCHKRSDPNESADFTCPEKKEHLTMIERLQSSFEENHNKTIKILKIATNDLLCKITKTERCDPCSRARRNDLECLNAAKESYHSLLESVCTTVKSLSKFTRKTIDSFIGSQEKCDPEEPPACKLRKTSGKPEDLITVVKESTKQIINDLANKNTFEEEQSQQKDAFEIIKHSATKILNDLKKISQDEFDTVKQITLIKESCIDLFDKTSKILSDNTSDSPDENEPSTYFKEVLNGVIVFHREDDIKISPEQNLYTRGMTNIRSVLSSLSDTFKELGPADPSKNNSLPRRIICDSGSEKSFTISNIFATMKEKIYSKFCNDEKETTSSTSSSSSFSEQNDDDPMG